MPSVLGLAKRDLMGLGAESLFVVASYAFAKMILQWWGHFGKSIACYNKPWFSAKAPKDPILPTLVYILTYLIIKLLSNLTVTAAISIFAPNQSTTSITTTSGATITNSIPVPVLIIPIPRFTGNCNTLNCNLLAFSSYTTASKIIKFTFICRFMCIDFP